MTSYDSKLLQENADELYTRASALLASYAAVGAVVGWAGVFLLEPLIRTQLRLPESYSLIPLQFLAAFLAAVIGGVWGYGKGLALKLQAQMALCQMKIEQNTSQLEAIELNTCHLAGIEHNTSRLEKIEEKIEEYISHSEERAAVASFSR
jgi:hypothetical protein